MSKISKNICAIVVSFNPDIAKLKLQMERLILQVNTILVIDNNSNNYDDIMITLSNIYNKDIFIIKNNTNLGLGAAQNIGIKQAIAKGAEYILLMDDDSTVEEGFVGNLLSGFGKLTQQGKKIGAIGPIYFNKETKEQYPITKYIGPFIQKRKPNNKPCEASFLISSGCLIPVKVIEAVGMMNEELFIDYIDVEWSFRARKLDYQLYAIPSAKMNHVIGERRLNVLGRKVSYHSPLRKYYLFRNSIYMIKCPYISFGYKLRELFFNGLRFFVYLFYSSSKKEFIRYSIMGLYDGIKSKMGECNY